MLDGAAWKVIKANLSSSVFPFLFPLPFTPEHLVKGCVGRLPSVEKEWPRSAFERVCPATWRKVGPLRRNCSRDGRGR